MAWTDNNGNMFPTEEEAREHALENMTASDYVDGLPNFTDIIEKMWTYYPKLWEAFVTAFTDELLTAEETYFNDNYYESDEDECEAHSNYNYDEVQEEYERNAGGL